MKTFFSFSLLARVVASVLLFWALERHPYGYYILLGWAVCGVSAYSAYISTTINRIPWAWFFGIVALLFNPLIPVRLGRTTWAYIDVAVGIVFLASLFFVRENLPAKEGNDIQR